MPSCQNHNLRNGGRYAFDQIVGDRTWYGTMDLIDVSKFVHSHSNDIMAKYEAARNDHAAIKYYNVKWSWIFFRNVARWRRTENVGPFLYSAENLGLGRIGPAC